MIAVNLPLRVTLIVGSVLVLVVVMRKVRKAGLEISDSIFWLGISFLLLVVALVPQLAFAVSDFLGFDSASNFVFLSGIVVLLARTFTQDRKIAVLKKKLATLAQSQALDETERRD